MKRGSGFVVLCLALAACTETKTNPKTPDGLRAEIQALADRCSPSGKIHFELEGVTALRVRSDPSIDYSELDCFLEGIKRYRLNLGFTGNEAPIN